MTYLTTEFSPSAHGESRRRAFRPHQPPHNRAWHRIPLRCHGHLTRASERPTRRLGLQSLENASPVAATTRILVNRHKSYLDLLRGVTMQTSAGQWLPRRIKKEEMKRRIIHRIALTTAFLTPRLVQNSPAEVKVSVPFAGGFGTSRDHRLICRLITSDNICHIKSMGVASDSMRHDC